MRDLNHQLKQLCRRNLSKARTVDAADLDKVRDPHVRMSLELQSAFGLRREEAIKIRQTHGASVGSTSPVRGAQRPVAAGGH